MINVTFFNEKVHPEVPKYQKAVFDAMHLPLIQVDSKDWKGHAGEINAFMEGLDKTADNEAVVIIWDVDCIPVKDNVVYDAVVHAKYGELHGIRQHASHIEGSKDYVGPAFMAFTMGTWRALKKPKFDETVRGDCGAELTYLALENKIKVTFLEVTDVVKPMWDLDNGDKFGLGTTYANGIYHAFLSRKGNEDMFVNKCQGILGRLKANTLTRRDLFADCIDYENF